MEFNIKTISLPEVPFHWKDSVKKINLSIDMMKKVQVHKRTVIETSPIY